MRGKSCVLLAAVLIALHLATDELYIKEGTVLIGQEVPLLTVLLILNELTS